MQYGIRIARNETPWQKTERIMGLIMCGLLIFIMLTGIGLTLFSLLFRDARGIGLYGNRGNVYMNDDSN